MTYSPSPAGLGTRESSVNSSTTALGSSASYTGEWEQSEYPHALVNVYADQDGTLLVDFGIAGAGGAIISTFTQETPVYAGRGDFVTLVVGAGRYIRVRYENGISAQGSFALHTSFGFNYLPVSASNDNEILMTVTERERDVFVALRRQNIISTSYGVLIDLSDTANFKHDRTGRVDLTNTYFSIDRDSTGAGSVLIGVITRIDATDADISYVAGVSFEKSDDRSILRDRKYSPSQLKLGVSGGTLTRVASSVDELTVAAVNTATALDSPLGTATVTPAVGDLIVKFDRTAGSYNAAVSAMFHGEFTP